MSRLFFASNRDLPGISLLKAARNGHLTTIGDKTVQATEAIVPSTMFIGLTVVFGLYFWFRYRMRHDMQQTIRTAIEKGQELSPDIIDRMGNPRPVSNADLRKAVIWVASAAGIGAFGIAMGGIEEEVRSIMLGIAAFPLFIGVAYAILWRFAGGER